MRKGYFVKRMRFSLVLGTLVAGLSPSLAKAADYDISIPVAVRDNITTNVVITVRENPRNGGCAGRTLLTVPGLAHTAATWNPLIDQLFGPNGNHVLCRVASVDLPGHGKSGLPQGALYGSLTIDDYVTAVAGALDGLNARHIHPHAVIGHSMGGLIVEGLQAKLLSGHSSLVKRYGVYLAAVMSPGASREQPWTFADSGLGAQAIAPFIVQDPVEGPVIRPDAGTWAFFFFTNFAQQLSPGTPTLDEIVSRGYIADEALAAGVELEGVPPVPRLSVGTEPFAIRHGTRLLYINPSQDFINLRAEAQAGYLQLTGDQSMRGFIPVDDDFAVHDMFVAQPALLLQKIGASLWSNLM